MGDRRGGGWRARLIGDRYEVWAWVGGGYGCTW
nr:MAG TPA: hypothetical protein [Caudoviricetes sp.]